jgi:ubiquitin-like protein Pup
MAERMRRSRESRHEADGVVSEEVDTAVDKSDLRDELDDILDEIDEALEANAEEFVRSYVQKGGE